MGRQGSSRGGNCSSSFIITGHLREIHCSGGRKFPSTKEIQKRINTGGDLYTEVGMRFYEKEMW